MIKIFISSVQKEFAEERRLLCDYIENDALLSLFFTPFLFEVKINLKYLRLLQVLPL